MKRLFCFILMATASAICLSAQDIVMTDGYELADSLIYIKTDLKDASLVGKDIFEVMPSGTKGDRADAKIHQSSSIASAMRSHISLNSSRTLTGYRVRIFFDNKQNSRSASENVLSTFEARHHDTNAYRNYENPYFRVTVGNFRSKSEAMQFLQTIKGEYPSAVLVKEKIDYPVVDKYNSYVVDTVKVLRKVIL